MLDELKISHIMGKKTRTDLFVQEDRKVMEDMLRGRTGSGEDKIQYAELRLKSISGEYHWFDVIIRPLPLMGNSGQGGGQAGGYFAAEKQEQELGNRPCLGRAYGNLQQSR